MQDILVLALAFPQPLQPPAFSAAALLARSIVSNRRWRERREISFTIESTATEDEGGEARNDD